MLVKRQKVISFLIQNRIAFLANLYSLFFLMFGDPRPFVLEETDSMLVLLMTIASLLGFISSNLNLKCFNGFISFRTLWRDFLIEKSLLCRLTGVENNKSSTLFLVKLACLILFPVPMHKNKMELQKGYTIT